jgi:hypothetical protein
VSHVPIVVAGVGSFIEVGAVGETGSERKSGV